MIKEYINMRINKELTDAFEAHEVIALKQGASFAEIEEGLAWACVYCGFNKAAGGFGCLNELKEKYKDQFPLK